MEMWYWKGSDRTQRKTPSFEGPWSNWCTHHHKKCPWLQRIKFMSDNVALSLYVFLLVYRPFKGANAFNTFLPPPSTQSYLFREGIATRQDFYPLPFLKELSLNLWVVRSVTLLFSELNTPIKNTVINHIKTVKSTSFVNFCKYIGQVKKYL